MTFTEKRHAKKMAKIFTTAAYVLMIAWAVTIVGGLIKAMTTTGELNVSPFLMYVIGLMPVILCLVLGGIGQQYINKRVYYKQAIAEYRQCSFFTQAINLVMVERKEFMSQAVDLYELIDEDTPRRRFLFGFIIASNYFSTDKERVTKGKKRLEEILNAYDPMKVKFKK
jgi:uncharacterized membrane protein